MAVYITGDRHGEFRELARWAKDSALTEEDTIIILGDAGINYFEPYSERWHMTMKPLKKMRPTLFCIHGNHEERPENVVDYYGDIPHKFYRETVWNGGAAWVNNSYPRIVFAKSGEVYDIDGNKCLAIGGAYSVDKHWRLQSGQKWFASEQLTMEEREAISRKAVEIGHVDAVLSHTCPFKYRPTEWFLNCIDQSLVDTSMELWLDEIEESIGYERWYCGHFHGEKVVDKMRFMFESIERFME